MSTRRVLYILLAVSVVLYAALAVMAHLHHYFEFDLQTTLALQSLRSRPLDILMAAISWPGYFPEFVPCFALILLVFWRFRLRVEAVIMSVAELGVGAMGFVLKPIVARPRPSTGLVWVNDYLPKDPFSFTAGHVHTFMVIFGFIAFLAWTRQDSGGVERVLLVGGSALFLLAEGFARVYLGDHWLSDVAGGYLAGSIWLLVAIIAYVTWRDRKAAPRARRSQRVRAA